jgi:hypothetical protein
MNVILKFPKSKREIEKEWLAHQLEHDPNFLTRREFLGKGVAGVTAISFMPSLFALLTQSKTAKAANDFSKAAAILSLPGGFSLSGEAVPQTVSGAFLTLGSYKNLGVPGTNPSTSGAVSTKYGAPLWTSQRLFKAFEAASSQVKNNLKVVVGWHSNSQDDSSNNTNMPAPHILASIANSGTRFRVMGTQVNSNTASGGRGLATADFAGAKPAVATTLAQAQNLLSLKQGSLSQMSTNSLIAASSLAKRLTETAALRFAAMNSGQQLSDISRTSANEVVNNVSSESVLDPRADAPIAQAFGISAATPLTDPKLPLAANVQLLANGISPVTVIQVQSNFDYHNNTADWNAPNGAHDQVVQVLMPLLESCAAKRKSVIVMLATDGATGFGADSQTATGDKAAIHGVAYIVLSMNNEIPVQKLLLGGMKSSDTAGGSAETDTNLNILQKSPSYEGHVLTASLLGMQDLKPQDFVAGNITADDFVKLNIFKS